MTIRDTSSSFIRIWDAESTAGVQVKEGIFYTTADVVVAMKGRIADIAASPVAQSMAYGFAGTSTYVTPDQYQDDVGRLDNVLEEVTNRLADLEQEMEAIKATQAEEIIVLRSISEEEAKKEIREIFESGDILFYSEIATRLKLDLSLVVELCQELIHEGDIEVHDDSV